VRLRRGPDPGLGAESASTWLESERGSQTTNPAEVVAAASLMQTVAGHGLGKEGP
jgi:hypothetical protein